MLQTSGAGDTLIIRALSQIAVEMKLQHISLYYTRWELLFGPAYIILYGLNFKYFIYIINDLSL